MKKVIRHRFESRAINLGTKTLLIGTFNPETPENDADFFYRRKRNYMWNLLPESFFLPALKGSTRQQKEAFISEDRINFMDLISAVTVKEEQETNYSDTYICKNTSECNTILSRINSLKSLEKILYKEDVFRWA